MHRILIILSCCISVFTNVPFIAVPHTINCCSSYTKTLVFIKFKEQKTFWWCQCDTWAPLERRGLWLLLFHWVKSEVLFTKDLKVFCCLLIISSDCYWSVENVSRGGKWKIVMLKYSKLIIKYTMGGQGIVCCHSFFFFSKQVMKWQYQQQSSLCRVGRLFHPCLKGPVWMAPGHLPGEGVVFRACTTKRKSCWRPR